jgi:uncharacterized protein
MEVDISLPIGQQQARTRWGTHESGAAFDRKKSSYLTEQAQAFMEQQAFCVLAGRGPQQELDGQIAMEKPGFVEIIDEYTCLLHLSGQLRTSLLFQGLEQAAGGSNQVGLFFICHPTRERLCVHGEAQLVARRKATLFWPFKRQETMCMRLDVHQAFFHCSKYVRTKVAGLTAPAVPSANQRWHPQRLLNARQDHLSEEIRAFLSKQVLCFLCTVGENGQCTVNHRGGAPGFLLTFPPDRLSPGGMVILPDYAGNGAFEALGNILETGFATLVVPNYAAQMAVCIAGTAGIFDFEELPAWLAQKCPGAARAITVSVQRISVQHGDWSTALVYERARAESLGVVTDPAVVCSV